MSSIKDSASKTLLKIVTLFLVVFSLGFLVTGITSHATDSSADQGGASSGLGASGSTPDSNRSGWLIYVIGQSGALKSPDVNN